MLNLADKVQKDEPESDKKIAEAVEETEDENAVRIDKQQIIARWRIKNRNNYIALQVLCVFFGAALMKFIEYLLR